MLAARERKEHKVFCESDHSQSGFKKLKERGIHAASRSNSWRREKIRKPTCGSGLHTFGLQRVLGDPDQFAKRGGVRGREVSKDLAVERAFGRLQALDEPAVGDARGACGGVDADLAEVAPASAMAEDLAAGGDFEPFAHRLFGFDAFGTSHKINLLSKRARNIGKAPWLCKRHFPDFRFVESSNRQTVTFVRDLDVST